METADLSNKRRKMTQNRKFDWGKVSKRHVLIKFFYFGWDYSGLTLSDNGFETVESHMFAALQKCCLIDDIKNSNYNRCGRTDAGVSAISQVISLDLRSNHKEPSESNCSDELDYCKMLNRLLPENIRCYAWCHVGSKISARFDCTERSYNYFFPRGNLNLQAMRTGVKLLLGTHDFRNLCKMDVGNGVVSFIRTVSEADIIPATSAVNSEDGFQMMKLVIKSKGFLWHQIRCIMALLLFIGDGSEDPSIISKLLDIDSNQSKPHYPMATAAPLALASAEFGELSLQWNVSHEEMQVLSQHLQAVWTQYAVKASIVRETMDRLSQLSSELNTWKRQVKLFNGVLPRSHMPLLSRPTCLSLEERITSVAAKRKRENADHENPDDSVK